MNTLLIGPRGAGKSVVAPHVAAHLRQPWIDLDQRVLAQFARSSVTQVWKEAGEPAWRAAESRLLCQHLRENHQVIALGGGTPLVPAARSAIEKARQSHRALVVYLSAPADVLSGRLLRETGDRPPLLTDDALAEVAAVLSMRHSAYAALADLVIDTADLTPAEVGNQIARHVDAGISAAGSNPG